MTEADFQKLIDPTKYQVFLFTCPAHIPLNAFVHPWFVVNQKGTISRWEIRYKKNKMTGDHLYKNDLPIFQGIEIFLFSKKFHWGATLVGSIVSDENGTAKKIADFITRSREVYPYCERYFLFGPNSDTYAEWILRNFPEWKIALPRNTIGKNYGANTKLTHGVIHGRFQPPHNGHIRIMIDALKRVTHLTIGICTPTICTKEEAEKTGYPCTAELNPFNFEERKQMITAALLEVGLLKERFTCVPFPSDYKNIETLVPKESVFFMSVTGEGDRKKITHLESLGYTTKTIYQNDEGASRERSGLIRAEAENGNSDWENMVPESVKKYLKNHDLFKKLPK
ncbi:MAG: DUF3750 domain-containing protein [Candidatus Pacebacteria bacterium]|nr:DUF3750 domain-containing protein [Candidatus Paceibacterota bacterium]